MSTATKTEKCDGVQWYNLTGTDNGTGIEFDNDVYGVTDDGQIVDSDNCPLECDSDWQTIAVKNTIGL